MSGFRPGRPFWIVVALMALLVVAAGAIVAVAFTDGAAPQPAVPADVTVRVVSSGGAGLVWKDVALAAASLGSALVAAAALLVSMWNTDRTMSTTEATGRAQRQREANRAELARLEGLIATFHMPYLVLARSNNNMAQDLRDRLRDPGYRMLVSLFEPGWLGSLSKGDRTLVREICATVSGSGRSSRIAPGVSIPRCRTISRARPRTSASSGSPTVGGSATTPHPSGATSTPASWTLRSARTWTDWRHGFRRSGPSRKGRTRL